MAFLLPLVAAIVPLIVAPGILFYFDVTPKVVVLLLGTAAAMCLWRGDLPLLSRPPAWIALAIAAQIPLLALATTFSPWTALSLNGGNWRRLGFVAFAAVLLFALLVICDCAGRPRNLRRYLYALAISSLPVAAYGIAQHFGLDPLVASTAYHAGEAPFTIVRPPSTLGHASYFATWLVFAAFAGVAIVAAGGGWISKLTGGLAILFSVAGVIFSGSRGALAGILVGALLLVFRIPIRKPVRVFTIAIAAVAAVAALYSSPAGAGLRNRVRWAFDEPAGGARPLLWRDSLRMAARRPVLGYGPESFATEFPRYQSVELSKAYPDFHHESPHNILLDTLLAQGPLGLALFGSSIVVACAIALKQSGRVGPALGAALAAGVTAQQFTSFTAPTALVTYLFIALIAASAVSERRSWVAPRWVRGVLLIPAAAAGVWCVNLLVADRHLRLTSDAAIALDVGAAARHYAVARRWHPPGSSADLYVSRELANVFRRTSDVRVKLQVWPLAFDAAVTAARTAEDRHNAFYNLAVFFATQNDSASVERSLRNAAYLAPNWFKPHWSLSRLLLVEGRLDDAQAEAQLAAQLNNGKDPEVATTLQEVRSRLIARTAQPPNQSQGAPQ